MPQCPFCPYSSSSSHMLLNHLQVHSVKFLCYICLETFPTNRHLVEHEKHNHPGPTYQCGSCTGQPSGQADPRHHEDHPVIIAPPHHTVQAHLNARRSFQVDFWGQEIHCTSNIPWTWGWTLDLPHKLIIQASNYQVIAQDLFYLAEEASCSQSI